MKNKIKIKFVYLNLLKVINLNAFIYSSSSLVSNRYRSIDSPRYKSILNCYPLKMNRSNLNRILIHTLFNDASNVNGDHIYCLAGSGLFINLHMACNTQIDDRYQRMHFNMHK